MKSITRLFAVTFTLILSNIANASTDEAIAAAEKARKAAAAVGYEWRDTGSMIKQAKALAAKGNHEKAIQVANKAEEEGKDALKQYHTELKRYSK